VYKSRSYTLIFTVTPDLGLHVMSVSKVNPLAMTNGLMLQVIELLFTVHYCNDSERFSGKVHPISNVIWDLLCRIVS